MHGDVASVLFFDDNDAAAPVDVDDVLTWRAEAELGARRLLEAAEVRAAASDAAMLRDYAPDRASYDLSQRRQGERDGERIVRAIAVEVRDQLGEHEVRARQRDHRHPVALHRHAPVAVVLPVVVRGLAVEQREVCRDTAAREAPELPHLYLTSSRDESIDKALRLLRMHRKQGRVVVGLTGVGLVSLTLYGAGVFFATGQLAAGLLAIGQAGVGLIGWIGQVGAGTTGVGQLIVGWLVRGQLPIGKDGKAFQTMMLRQLHAALAHRQARVAYQRRSNGMEAQTEISIIDKVVGEMRSLQESLTHVIARSQTTLNDHNAEQSKLKADLGTLEKAAGELVKKLASGQLPVGAGVPSGSAAGAAPADGGRGLGLAVGALAISIWPWAKASWALAKCCPAAAKSWP